MFSRLLKIIVFIIYFSQIFIAAQKKEIVAYYMGRGSENRGYFVKNLKTSGAAGKITILNYSFAVPGQDPTGKIVLFSNNYVDYEELYSADKSIDGIADDSAKPLRGQFNQLKKLKAQFPGLKILLSIGGWGGCKFYSDAALTPESREIFVNDCIDKFIKGNLSLEKNAGGKAIAAGIFDGFDLDWEFPVSGGMEGTHYNVNDRENFTKLLEVFRRKLDAINPKLLLTAAVAADVPNVNNYDFKSAEKYLNWLNLMTYDFHGVWNNAAAHHTNLLSDPADTTEMGMKHSYDKSVKYYVDSIGISSRKIIPGVAFYGKCWDNVEPANGGLYQPGTFAAHGFGNYSLLCKLENEGYKYYWDTVAMAPYLYNPDKKIFWTFDDPKSVALKSRYADAYNLGGVMFWEISGDDSVSTLLNTIYKRNMPDYKYDKNQNGVTIPLIKITKPLNNDAFAAGSNLIIKAVNEENGSPIMKAEFFGDGISLGYATKAPFEWAWFNLPKGRHRIKAIATDSKGNTAYSKEVEINVR